MVLKKYELTETSTRDHLINLFKNMSLNMN